MVASIEIMNTTSKPIGLAKIWREIKRPFVSGKLFSSRKLAEESQFTKTGMLMVLSKLTGESMLRCEGIIDEYRFWEGRLSGADGQKGFSDKTDIRLKPDSEITEPHASILEELSRHVSIQDIAILDVGAGPLTVIHKIYKGVRLNITAIDVLAEYYDNLLQKYGIDPPVRTQLCNGEAIAQRFPEKSFHWINAQNTIDHMKSPVECIKGMLPLLKPGGIISLFHCINEGCEANYTGFHQWDLFVEDDDFCIAGKDRTNYTNVTKMLLPHYRTDVEIYKWGSTDRDALKVIVRRGA